jgi:hypothetical protein
MSKEIGKVEALNTVVFVNSYYGGDKLGRCIQLTPTDDVKHVTLTEDQAREFRKLLERAVADPGGEA